MNEDDVPAPSGIDTGVLRIVGVVCNRDCAAGRVSLPQLIGFEPGLTVKQLIGDHIVDIFLAIDRVRINYDIAPQWVFSDRDIGET